MDHRQEKDRTTGEGKTGGRLSIERQRAILRKSFQKNPTDQRILRALRQSLHPRYVYRAARQGIFVCYSPADALFALDLKTSLEDVGASVWLDEISAPAGLDWQDAVKHGLRENGLMALVITPEAMNNPMVLAEYRYFISMGKIVQPLLLRGEMPDLPELQLQPIDFRSGFLEGLDNILSALGLNAAAQG